MTMISELLRLSAVRKIEPGPDGDFPIVIRSTSAGCALAEWLTEHADPVWDLVRGHGAVLFRGFTVGSAEAFERAVLAVTANLHSGYGDLAQTVENCRFVQEATPYPSKYAIPFHNEASHTPSWPEYIWFYAQTTAASGGETPLLDCELLLRRLPAALRDKFAARGLQYTRNFVSGLDVPWQRFFATDDPRTVESRCRELGMEWSWRQDGGLQTVTRRPAILPHPRSGKPVFFNQVLLHHQACLDGPTRDALVDLFGEDDLPRSVQFGDGAPIPPALIEEIVACAVDTAVCFTWQSDDVLMVDNIAVAHARRPFSGRRCVRVALSSFTQGDQRKP